MKKIQTITKKEKLSKKNIKDKTCTLKDKSNLLKKEKLFKKNNIRTYFYDETFNNMNNNILDYTVKNFNAETSRIPRCSTGFDNKIPGYFNSYYGTLLKNIEVLGDKYDYDLYNNFKGEWCYLNVVKKKENEMYLDFFEKK
ncbi:uncharacterized protein VNE69_12199 [Vairimorpha necatrix]|uniref:Uncharacterized protein n=1 Tax=Vairimorpha necatrix TaxID=6039 RepID=A0AAX4JGU6_9MICR